jgi:hypothetical protein
VTHADATTVVQQLQELIERKARMAEISPAIVRDIAAALTWVGGQHAKALHVGETLPYALGRLADALKQDALRLAQTRDTRAVLDFIATIDPAAPAKRRRK